MSVIQYLSVIEAHCVVVCCLQITTSPLLLMMKTTLVSMQLPVEGTYQQLIILYFVCLPVLLKIYSYVWSTFNGWLSLTAHNLS